MLKRILLFCVVTLALVGTFSSVLLHESYLQYYSIFIALVAIGVLVYFLRFVYVHKTRFRGFSFILFACFCTGIFSLFIFFTFIRGLPTALHYLSAKASVQAFTVEKKYSHYEQAYCFGGIRLQEFQFYLNREICGLQKQDWQQLKKGDKLLLLGKRSPFGFTFKQYQKIKAESIEKL